MNRMPFLVVACVILGISVSVFHATFVLSNEQSMLSMIKNYGLTKAGYVGYPWQYRVGCHWILRGLNAILPAKIITMEMWEGKTITFKYSHQNELGLRTLFVVGVFLTLCWYLSTLGVKNIIWGLALLTPIFAIAELRAFITPDTYLDNILYLLAGIAVLRGGSWWIVPLTAIGALNRETACFIPLLLLLNARKWEDVTIASLSMFVFLYIFCYLRHIFPPQFPVVKEHHPGIHTLVSQFTDPLNWSTAVCFLAPLLVYPWRAWWGMDRRLRNMTLVMFSYFVFMLFLAPMREMRSYLNPMLLSIIPGILLAREGVGHEQ